MKRICALVAIVLATSSCTTLPELPPEAAFDLNLVVQNIRCELLHATKEVHFVFDDTGWNAGLDLSVQVNNTAKGSANANLGIPLVPGVATPTLVVARTGAADRTVTMGFKQELSKPILVDCNRDNSTEGSLLSSNLGIREWMIQVQNVIDVQKKIDKDFSPKTVGTTIKFVITSTGTTGINFTMIPLGKNTLGGGASLEATRTATHNLIVALSKNPPPPKPTEVIIVGNKTLKPGAPASRRTGGPSSKELNDRVNDDAILQELLRQKLSE